MRGLSILVLTDEPERFRGALAAAAAQAALGGSVAMFLQLDAVALLRAPVSAPRDAAHRAAGLPTLDALIAEALALGVTITACQSGLALSGMRAEDLPGGIETGGPVGFLQGTADAARLVLI